MAETIADLVRIGEPVPFAQIIVTVAAKDQTSSLIGQSVTCVSSAGSQTETLGPNYQCSFFVTVSGSYVITLGSWSKTVAVTVPEKGSLDVTCELSSAPAISEVPWDDTSSWKDIMSCIQAYYDGSLDLATIKNYWKVGQSKTLNLAAINSSGSGWNVGESHRAQSVKITIMDFDHDTLATARGGKTKALLSWTQKDCLRAANVSDTGGSNNSEHGYMNSSNTNSGSWNGSARRGWCNNGYYGALPDTDDVPVKRNVKQVQKQTCQSYNSSSLQTSSDYIWLPSEWEVFGSKNYAVAQEGTQYEYYKTASNRYKLPKWSSSNSSDYWWERSPNSGGSNSFCRVSIDGSADIGNASYTRGLAPCGCF